MQKTSDIFDRLYYRYVRHDANVHTEVKVEIGNQVFTKGTGLQSVRRVSDLFSGNSPEVGACVSAQLTVVVEEPTEVIPRQAVVKPYIRMSDGVTESEWLPKGQFWIDTRSTDRSGNVHILTLNCYDAMIYSEADCPRVSKYPITDVEMVTQIARALNVGIDDRALGLMSAGYQYEDPQYYSMREILGYIGASYGGCWCITDEGKLNLVSLYQLPADVNYLVNEYDHAILFGGDRIIV